ncbi:MAG: adenylate/guanylate cyclase domain-containing protein [Kiloniellales bacterium]|nr:adenylate/guanylate cyclase domain-containing protein [Kiloniellales bacterium]
MAVVIHADVVGSTELVRLDEMLAHQRIQDAFRRFSQIIADHHGTAHEIRGDALVAEFSTVSDAVRASIEFQTSNQAYIEQLTDEIRPAVRVGIAMGEVVIADNTVTGEGVILAQRIEQLAHPGGVCLLGAAYDTVPKRLAFHYENLGEHELKGFSEPVRVYAVLKSPGDLAPTLPKAKTASPPDEPSIAVLPLTNMSGDPEQEYFADGITEDIITELSKIRGLLVISRNSTFTYKGRTAKAQDVSHDLGARYVLEGSVRRAGERVRITAQLIDGTSGGHLWAERYDRNLADIFAVQDDVTDKIVRALEINLFPEEQDRRARVDTKNPEAYDYVLRGREQYRLYTEEGNLNARRLFERAIEIDPEYASAYAGLAETYMHDWFRGAPDALEHSYDLAQRANALNPDLPLVYEALGNIQLFRKRHADGVAAAEEWVKIEPGSADAYANLAGALHFYGEQERVIQLVEKAMQLNPYYPFYYLQYVGQAYFAMARYEDAIEALRRTTIRNPEALTPLVYLAACFGLVGRDEDARESLAEVRRIYPEISTAWVNKFMPYRRAADSDRLVEGLRKAGLSE